LLISLIIRTRTRVISGVYQHTRHVLFQEVVTDLYTLHFLCQKLAARIILDLRVHRVVTAQFYENGDSTDDGSSAGQI
jgi:hypothetical protein